jgi:hypothetical protein
MHFLFQRQENKGLREEVRSLRELLERQQETERQQREDDRRVLANLSTWCSQLHTKLIYVPEPAVAGGDIPSQYGFKLPLRTGVAPIREKFVCGDHQRHQEEFFVKEKADMEEAFRAKKVFTARQYQPPPDCSACRQLNITAVTEDRMKFREAVDHMFFINEELVRDENCRKVIICCFSRFKNESDFYLCQFSHSRPC